MDKLAKQKEVLRPLAADSVRLHLLPSLVLRSSCITKQYYYDCRGF